MGNDEIVIAIALISAIIVLITVKVIEFFVRFNNETRYITAEMHRAYDYSEYRRWRGELRCHYLCLIPFVNERNVMRLYRRIYHKPKHENTEKRSDGLYHILAPSVIGIFICVVCLCGASWAWFTTTQTNSIANIQTATYTVTVTAKKDDTDIPITENSGTFNISLESGNCYSIILTANGTANNGYCTVKLGEETYHTPQIEKGTSFTFEVNAYQNGDLTITPQWGTCSETDIINAEIPLEFGTKLATDNNEPSGNAVTATPQVTFTTPENTTPTVDTDTETTAPENTDEPVSEPDTEQEQEPKSAETTETDSKKE